MDKYVYSTFYWACDYVSLLELKFIRFIQWGPWPLLMPAHDVLFFNSSLYQSYGDMFIIPASDMGNVTCDFSDIGQCGYKDISNTTNRWIRRRTEGKTSLMWVNVREIAFGEHL